MAYVLPESVLEGQLCTSCKRYLSCPPTKIYVTGEIKCGRCSSSDDGGTVSMFDTLARNLLFPCSSRYEGCSALLPYKDIGAHEINCNKTLVSCPTCATPESSVFYLIHHFKTKHAQHILPKACIECPLNEEFTRHLLYRDNEKNVVFMLKACWNREVFALSCSALISPQHSQLALKFSGPADCEDDSNLHTTDFLNYSNEYSYEYHVPVHLTTLRCTLLFTHMSPMTKIVEFHPKGDQKYKKRTLRKMFLNSAFKKKYKIVDAAELELSPCGLKLEHENYSVRVACNFCENFFISSIDDKIIFHNGQCYVCSTCYHRGVRLNWNDKRALKELTNKIQDFLNFYCKHGCGKFFRSEELLKHEDQCRLNLQRSLCEEEFVQLAFGDDFFSGERYSRENVICDARDLEGTGKIFVATPDNFKCVIDYERDLEKCYFHVNHEYDTEAYYISIHKWENQKFSEEYNDFSMKMEGCEGPSLFAVNLKEMQEDLDIFFDV